MNMTERRPDLQDPPTEETVSDETVTDTAVTDTIEAAPSKGLVEDRERQRVEDLLAQLERDIEAGKLKPANKRATSIVRSLEKAGGKLPDQLGERYRQLSEQLKELKDWHGFATRPKREALCDQMEALKDESVLHPAEKARAIKELQDAWKALGPSDSIQDQKLWARFSAAADVAFAPCAEYFGEQREQRENNLRVREEICAQLEAFVAGIDWEQCDWKGTQKILDRAKQEWRSLNEVPRSRQKKLQARFDDVMEEITRRVREEEQRNHDIKSDLIAQVRALVASEEIAVAERIQRTKQIQNQWRQVGITQRRRDQKLWKAFRTQCDQVFELRETEAREQRANADKLLAAAREAINVLRVLTDADDVTPTHINAQRDAVKALRIEDKAIMGALAKETRRAHQVIEQRAHASARERLSEAKRKSHLCEQVELGVMDREAALSAWESEVALEPHVEALLCDRRDGQIMASNESAQRLCVRMEILAGLESPADAQALRLEYQVDRLNRELSQGQKETRGVTEQAEALLLDWFATPLSDEPLKQRFEHATLKVLGTI